MWYSFLLDILKQIALIIGIKTLDDKQEEVEALEYKLKVRDEVKSIKEANSKLTRDERIAKLRKKPKPQPKSK